MSFGANENMYAVRGVTVDDVWMVGNASSRSSLGRAHHFDGKAWVSLELPIGTQTLRSVWPVSHAEAYAVGTTGLIAWDGSSWQNVPVPDPMGSSSLTSVYAPAKGVVFVGSDWAKYIAHKR
jgi:hypothetical protein